MEAKYAAVAEEIARLEHSGLPPSPELNAFLESLGTSPVEHGATLAELLRRPRVSYAALAPFDPERPPLPAAVAQQAEIRVKYDGYIRRQTRQVEEFSRMEDRLLPEDIDYASVTGLRLEAREKLARLRPESFGQAGRVSGVSPADLAALMVYLGKA